MRARERQARKGERDRIEKNPPTERQQFRYILSKIAFTGRCVSQIGRRFHWLRIRDDTWSRVAAFYLAKTVVFMHFTIKEKRRGR